MKRTWFNTARRAFSVVELIITIGILSLIIIGVATIFGSVGDTVTAGQELSERGRRVSQLEQTLREDFRRLSRRGSMVIRHEYAIREDSGPTDVPLSEDDPSPRPRRIDQVMFFVEADPGRRFSTLRRAVEPTMIASGTEARIWYGHGQLVRPGAGDTIPYADAFVDELFPNLSDTNIDENARLGFDPGPGVENPNEFAGDWSLLRHQTVLIPPTPTELQRLPEFPDDRLLGVQVNRDIPEQRAIVTDAPFQVQLQPAMSSAFWSVQTFTSGGADLVNSVSLGTEPLLDQKLLYNRVYDDAPPSGFVARDILQARATSGLVDIATTSLDEIRSIATAADFDVRGGLFVDAGGFADQLAIDIATDEGANLAPFPNSALSEDGTPSRTKARHWLIDLLPTFPLWTLDGRSSPRPRFDRVPAGLLGEAAVTGDALDAAYTAADGEVLTRWEFLPGCTEFIVEYAFGEVYNEDKLGIFQASPGDARYGQLIWYGRDRFALDAQGNPLDVNGDGNAGNPADRVAHTYRPATLDAGNVRPQELLIGFAGPPDGDNYDAGSDGIRRAPYESVFGYRDPLPKAGLPSEDERQGLWPWPTLVRITLFFPRNPADLSEGETSYEMIFQVPQD